VLGFVTGGLTVLMSLIILFAVVGGDDEPSTVLMLLGLPCAAGLIAGAAVLMGRGSPNPLFGSALAAAAVLVLVLFVGVATLDADGRTGVSMFVVLALPLPVLTAVFARVHRTVGWAATG
jgi:hypothetical protein